MPPGSVLAPVLGSLDRWLLAEGTHQEAYRKLGAHPLVRDGKEGTAFAVWAPNARRVAVVGDFNGWDDGAHTLVCFGAPGIWEGFIPGARRGDRYKLAIDGPDGRRLPLKADPFALRSELFPSTNSVVEGLSSRPWGDVDWMRARRVFQSPSSPISMYEVHLGSWRRHPDGTFLGYVELAERLAEYVSSLGFTHVELLPVSEHPLYESWGYQPLGLFSPTSRFGSPDDFRTFVDVLHRAGIGVILDWVPAHFPADDYGLSLFDGTHLYEHADPRQGRHPDWGTLVFNYGRTEVQNFLISNALYWLEEFHIDGLRVDAVASMLYLDYSKRAGEWIPNRYGGRENIEAVEFLRRLNTVIHREFPDVITIAEESTAWPGVSKPPEQGGLGFDYKWNMGWMHDTRNYLKVPIPARVHHHDRITFTMWYKDAEHFVLPLSHDEVVHGKSSLLWGTAGFRDEQFANLRLWFTWQWVHAGKKLLFMGDEFAQDHEWWVGGELQWWLTEHLPHSGMQRLVRDLNTLYREIPAFHEKDNEPDGFYWLDCSDFTNSVLSVVRRGKDDEAIAVAILNFGGLVQENYRLGAPLPGKWREALNSDAAIYGGRNVGNMGKIQVDTKTGMHGYPQSFVLTLPALGALVLVRD